MNNNKINKFLAERLNFVVLKSFPKHSIRFAKKYFKNKPINAVEIGTYEGFNAKSMLKTLNINKLYSIDPYKEYEDYVNLEGDKNQIHLSKIEKKAKRRLKNFSNKIIWIKKFSDNAIKDIPKDIDLIYIDGNHEYEYVIKDMKNYYKKVRVGGILAGHDITSFKGVSKAFVEFCSRYKLEPNITRTDWWVIKK